MWVPLWVNVRTYVGMHYSHARSRIPSMYGVYRTEFIEPGSEVANRMGCRVCWLSLIVVVTLAGIAGYRLFMGAHTHVGTDGRAEIALTAADRDIVLAEMRAILGAVQGVTSALTQDDLKLVAQQARSVGLAAMGQVPPSLMQALPLEFKTLGRDMHAEFDRIALDAEQMGDREHALQQVSAILNKCVACHATYRLTASKDGG